MSDTDPNSTDTPVELPVDSPATPPAETPPATPAADATREHFANNADIVAAINGLPEAVANAVKEAIPAPPKPAPAPKTKSAEKVETPPPAPETKPGRKSFTEWWFGQ